jgi:hypothetical protein
VGIFKGEGNDCSYLVAHLSSMLVLNANVEVWPTSVSESGESVTLLLTNFSGDQKNPCRCKYILNFFEEVSAMNFFQIYCNALPKGKKGPAFVSLRDGVLTPAAGKNKAAAADTEEDYDDFMSSGDDDSMQMIVYSVLLALSNLQGFFILLIFTFHKVYKMKCCNSNLTAVEALIRMFRDGEGHDSFVFTSMQVAS